jgi:ABC-type glutathione transport system ATPase component
MPEVKKIKWQEELLNMRNRTRPSPGDRSEMLAVRDISFRYDEDPASGGIEKISLSLQEGEVIAIAGKSGSGKTTLLKCIYGLFDLRAGKISMDGEEVTGPAYNLIPGHGQMELVSQEYHVLVNHSVQENFAEKLPYLPMLDRQLRVEKLLRLLELFPLRNMRARDLSSGQKQRVAIGRALASFPRLLLLDEPFSNIDRMLSEKLFSFILREAKKHHSAVIMITHLPEEALRYADRLAIMDKGRILQEGKVADVYYRPRNTRLAALMGDYNVISREDVEKNSPYRKKKKVFARPDCIVPCAPSKADIVLNIVSCGYNGKCYESSGETKTGNLIRLYSARQFHPGSRHSFAIQL